MIQELSSAKSRTYTNATGNYTCIANRIDLYLPKSKKTLVIQFGIYKKNPSGSIGNYTIEFYDAFGNTNYTFLAHQERTSGSGFVGSDDNFMCLSRTKSTIIHRADNAVGNINWFAFNLE